MVAMGRALMMEPNVLLLDERPRGFHRPIRNTSSNV
jgi:ABC-type branched-subunit amino acid transport system ATPase component